MEYNMGQLWFVLSILFCTRCPTFGQRTRSTLLLPECNTACPASKLCVQDNATVVWELHSSNECKSHLACYGLNSDYPDDTSLNNVFAGRFKPIVVALVSNLYFKARYANAILKPFTVYNVSQAMFLDCRNATQVVGVLTSTVEVPERFLSSLGYRFFIAKAKGRKTNLPCHFGLRLHVNVIDAANCSGASGGNLCSGKGRCIADSFNGDIRCKCCHGYTGPYCQELNACAFDPCRRGNCTDVVEGHGEAFNCTCEAGYTGQLCDIDINECNLPENSGVCQNGAYCDDGLNSYICRCATGFHGKHCELVSNMCELFKPCENDGNCSRVGVDKESYVCHCAPGFYGRNCTLNSTTSSLAPRLSSIPLTSLYQAVTSITSSAVSSYAGSPYYPATEVSYSRSAFQTATDGNTAPQFYTSVKTNPVTSDARTPGTGTFSLMASSGISESNSLMAQSLGALTESPRSNRTSSRSSVYHFTTTVFSTTNRLQTSTNDVSPATMASLVPSSHQSPPSATLATSVITLPHTPTPNLPITTPNGILSSPEPTTIPILPSGTIILTPSSTVAPTQRPVENQTCADNPCGEHGVCRDASTVAGLSFHCDCQYPTVGPVCTRDLELHFPYFNGNSYIVYKEISFGSNSNEFVISFRTYTDGTLLYSGHKKYRDFVKLEVIGGLLRFSVNPGDRVVAVTSQEIVANGNTISVSFGYDTRSGSVFMSVNNGREMRATTRGGLKNVQLYYRLYLGGVVPVGSLRNKPDVGTIRPFVGCVRELQFNERTIELSDAISWSNISECDVPACQAKPCTNSGVCVQSNRDLSDYTCQCSYPYSGKNCAEKYACDVNVCNGGECLNTTTSGVQCLCPFWKGGVSCTQDTKVSIPSFSVVLNHSSYIQYLTPRAAVDRLDLRMEIKLSNESRARRVGLLFYVGLHDHLSVGSDGDYLALGILDNRVVLQFNLGSGPAYITSEALPSNQDWVTILAGRKGRDGYLYVNNQLKESSSPPPLAGLNVFGHLYLGGVPEYSMLNSEVLFTEGFRGAIKDPRVRTGASNAWISLSVEQSTNITNSVPIITGRNIQDIAVNACVIGACLNNGTCESLGSSYVCRCSPEWSGMTCRDASVPCRDYNPCHGMSSCRMHDSGFRCDCPPGKVGIYCENDINITTPSFGEYSFLAFSLDKIKIHAQTSITVTFSTAEVNGILFYVARDMTSLSGDFMSITLNDRYVYLIYNLGSGIARCRSQNELLTNQRNTITVSRDARTASLVLNGNVSTCNSRGGATQLNVDTVVYLGGVPDISQVHPVIYVDPRDLMDFTGCVELLMINGRSFELSQHGALDGRNVGNCDTSHLQA